MTVSTSTNKIQYPGDNSTIVFPIPFEFPSNSDIMVLLNDEEWTLNTEYSLAGAGSTSGGSLTVSTSPTDYTPSDTDVLTIIRIIDITQPDDYSENDDLPAETLENSLDRLTFICQQINEAVNRAVLLPPSTTSSGGITIPDPNEGKALIWNDSGGLVNSIDNFNEIVSQAAAAQLAAEAASSAATGSANNAASSAAAAASSAAAAAASVPSLASQVEAEEGLNNTKYMTPLRTEQAIESNAVDQDSDTGAANLPTGTTAQRPDPAVEGMFRRNSETGAFEGYDGTTWAGVGGASGGPGNPFMYKHDKVVTEDYTLPGDQNAISAGPITIADGVTVTLEDGSTWSVV